MDLLLAKIDQLQSTLEATQLQVKEHKEDHEKRYLWLEQQVASLDNKCHKIQRASDNMRSSLQSVDFNELMSVPGAVQQLNLKQSTPTSNRSNTLLDNTTSNKLERQVQDLTDKVVQLLSHANEQSEMRNMMWRIDLSLRDCKMHLHLPILIRPAILLQDTVYTLRQGMRHLQSGSQVGTQPVIL